MLKNNGYCGVSKIDKNLVQELLSNWSKNGNSPSLYEKYHDKVYANLFDQSVTVLEVLYFGDLFFAWASSRKALTCRDSGYYLLRPWTQASTKEDLDDDTSSVLAELSRKNLFSLSYSVPISSEKQCEMIMEAWTLLKFGRHKIDDIPLWQHLAANFEWGTNMEDGSPSIVTAF